MQNKHQQLADYVIGAMMSRPDFYSSHVLMSGLRPEHFPDGKRAIFEALELLIAANTPLSFEMLSVRTSGRYDETVAHLMASALDLSQDTIASICSELVAEGERHRKRKELEQALIAMSKEDSDVDAISNVLVSKLMSNAGNMTLQAEAHELVDAQVESFNQQQRDTLLTGIRPIDVWTTGWGTSEFVAIVAAMKQRKTSLALTAMLNMALEGKSIAIMMFESNRQTVTATLTGMLAYRWLRDEGHLGTIVKRLDNGTPILAEYIKSHDAVKLPHAFRGKYQGLRYQAWQVAQAKLRTLPIRVYDKTRTGGGLSDLASIHKTWLMDMHRYNTTVVMIDHMQRINEGNGNSYEQMALVSASVENWVRSYEVTCCLLSQQNSSAINGTRSYNAGAEGGARLDAAVDTLYTVSYRREDEMGMLSPANEITVELKHSRYDDSGQRAAMHIDPYSGYVTG